jgi:hypothetical protein
LPVPAPSISPFPLHSHHVKLNRKANACTTSTNFVFGAEHDDLKATLRI